MIVGNRHIDVGQILQHRGRFRVLAERLVPSCCGYRNQLVDNQLYFMMLLVRNSKDIKWKERQSIVAEIGSQIGEVRGVLDQVRDISDIFHTVDMDVIFEVLFGKVETKLSEEQLRLALRKRLGQKQDILFGTVG